MAAAAVTSGAGASAASAAVGLALAGLLVGGLAGCTRGCSHGQAVVGSLPPVASLSPPLRGVDCPDGLARCEAGGVSVSRLATIPDPCHGPPGACECPWQAEGECAGGCAADGAEIVIEASRAMRQLCAVLPDADVFVVPYAVGGAAPGSPAPRPPSACDEGDRYRCQGGEVVDCAAGLAVARCSSGCFADGTSLDDDGISREAAFAILCSR
jgi:hypothetical protein